MDEESKEADELEKLVSRDNNDPGTEDTADSKTPRKFNSDAKRKAPKTDKFSKKRNNNDNDKDDGGSDLDVTEIG